MDIKALNVIITGATGMVGEGVLHECLNNPLIASITLLTRRPMRLKHPKVREVLLADFLLLTANGPGAKNLDACFYCLGTTSIGKTEEEYTTITYNLTLKIARSLLDINPGIIFCYVTAKGTDVSEKGKTMWARVKGRTENDLGKMAFRHFYAFRPFMLTPTKGLQNTHEFYKYISWLFPLGRLVYPEGFCTLKELALAMIQVGYQGYAKKIITTTDMVKLSKRIYEHA